MRATKPLNDKTKMVTRGYGWVEGNKLSARYNGKIFAQLPVAKSVTPQIIENGRFLKYDYANGVCDLTGPGEWLLVFNEVKVYQDRETDADFAMVPENYSAIVYNAVADGKYVHYIPGVGEKMEYDNRPVADEAGVIPPTTSTNGGMMPETATAMVPRLFKTDIGDIMTTNTIIEAYNAVNEGDILYVGDEGYLTKTKGENSGTMQWQVVKKYNMPDLQPGVKLMRVQ